MNYFQSHTKQGQSAKYKTEDDLLGQAQKGLTSETRKFRHRIIVKNNL